MFHGITVEDKHLIICLRVSSRNEYLILTSIECLLPHKQTLKISYKSKHFPPRYKRKCEWVFFFVGTRCITSDKIQGGDLLEVYTP